MKRVDAPEPDAPRKDAEGRSLASEVEALKRDVAALRADLSRTLRPAKERPPGDAPDIAGLDDAADAAKSALESRVRDHPFVAVGLALLAGYIAASLTRSR